MTQQSLLWTDGLGDGGPYSQEQLAELWTWVLDTADADADAGVLVGQLNGLAVTSGGNNSVTIASGRALVNGTFYENDAALILTGSGDGMGSPTTGTTGRRVVLRKDWDAQTIRLAIITSADGTAAIPALTQTAVDVWEIPLASFTITTGGVIGALTDQREHAGKAGLAFAVPGFASGTGYSISGSSASGRVIGGVVAGATATGIEGVYMSGALPSTARALRSARLLVYGPTGTSGNAVRLTIMGGYNTVGELTSANTGTIPASNYTLTGDETINAIDVSSLYTLIAGGDLFGLRVMRDGAHAGDTNATSLFVLGLVLEYV